MWQDTLSNKINRLKVIRNKILAQMSEKKTNHHGIKKTGNLWECKSVEGDLKHFYFVKEKQVNAEATTGRKAELIEHLLPYESSIDKVKSSYDDQGFTLVFHDKQTLKYGAVVLLPEKKVVVPVYEPCYHRIQRVEPWHIVFENEHGQREESIVTREGHVYQVCRNGEYIEPFQWKHLKTFITNDSSITSVLYYKDKPVYFSNYGLSTMEEIFHFIMDRPFYQRLTNEMYKTIEDFDSSFMAGVYGPQKLLQKK
ncbi:MAG: hypothetical protein PHN72_03310 [Bacilli bacterium]|nr:hypothetical protein [Bacilli bacterium]